MLKNKKSAKNAQNQHITAFKPLYTIKTKRSITLDLSCIIV